jgi:r-opsin
VVTRSFSAASITTKQTCIIILCAYILALFWTLMPVIGWSTYDYEGTGASCSIKWEERSLNVISYNITILIFVYLIPVIIIIIMNVKILKNVIKFFKKKKEKRRK